jgi:hypothetical protein
MTLSRDELIELFREAPKESFELLLRNLRIRECLQRLHAKHLAGQKLSYDEDFERIFQEFFRFFFRPLEITIRGVQQLRFLFLTFDLELAEAQNETLRAYGDFLRSWFDHLRLTYEMMLGRILPAPGVDVMREFIRGYRKRIESHGIELGYPTEYPFLLPKTVFVNLERAIDHWEKFSGAFGEYRGLIKGTYAEAAEGFMAEANQRRFENPQEFFAAFSEFEARAFDVLLKSPRYLEVQKSMMENMMDYIYFYRRFFEEMLGSNPANPFATVSMQDEAFRRILDLRRRVAELERRLSKLEEGSGDRGKD